MELDKMKEVWKKEMINEAPEISLEKQKEINLPMDKIRRNMKMEVWINIITIAVMIPMSYVFSENPLLRWSMLSVFIIILGYFTWQFHLFIRRSANFRSDTLYNLQEMKFELRLFGELYKAYYVSSIPFILAMLCLFILKKGSAFSEAPDLIIQFAPYIMFFVVIIFMVGFGSWWFNSYYGKYIKQVEKILQNLK